MSIHVAILQKPYLDALLHGRKTIESRLTRTAQPPFGQVEVGDRIYFKRSGGAFAVTARAARVHSHDNLTPAAIGRLRQRFNHAVGGDAAYWRSKREARFATFIELRDVQPIDVGPPYRKSAYKAWFVLPDEADPVFEVTLTAGAIRNGYVPVIARPAFFGGTMFELHLPDGRRVTSDLYRRQRIRWRGWCDYFHEHRLQRGDAVRFVREGRARYRVTLIHRT